MRIKGGFIKGRKTTDNAIIVLELLDSILKHDPCLGGDTRHLAIKLDMMKVYDCVNLFQIHAPYVFIPRKIYLYNYGLCGIYFYFYSG